MSDKSLRQDFDKCVALYKNFVKQSSTDDIQSLGIAESITNNTSGNKSVTFPPEDWYYDSNVWYALSKNDKDKVIKALINRNVGENSTKSGEQLKSGGVATMENGSI